ncbi:MAG TPA: bifunctional homocysteine S-methyltransferase/methylenetetrahydrofolate reductase [Holophaga sp.]|jgi:homocysteine S-methyltransferase|nr:bifunctional homocysteine S-methyltransferase/methylenetetrahydrofolate reductase [Holophaga sp.]
MSSTWSSNFRDALKAGQRFLFDGSAPTVLYERGVFINRSFDEVNTTSPELISEIYEEFRAAGAQILTTNTWAANRVKLQGYGLAESLERINIEGVRLARKVIANDNVWVAGCIGPLGLRIEPWGPTSFVEARGIFIEQAQALLKGGVDLFILESFEDLGEVQQAILAVKEICDLPVVALMTPNDEGQTLFGTEPEWYIRKLSEWGADMVGVNGGTGPAPLLDLLKRFKAVTNTPLVLRPSAGLPRMVDGRMLYMASPEYLGEFARTAFQLGAVGVGGDAGTTAAHTRAMRGALAQELAFVETRPEITSAEHGKPTPTVLFRERSAFSRKLADGQFVTTIELVPPKGTSPDKLLDKAKQAKELGIDAINVPDGPRAMARMSALATACLIEQRVGIETIMHFACRDRNLLGMQSDLLGAAALGLRNVLAITGDPPKLGPYPKATAVFDVDAIGLVNIVNRLNSGLDLGGTDLGGFTSFSVGVGANPMAIDLDREKERFRHKVEAGADWAMTQPVFDPDSLFRFLDFAQPLGVPIIAGLWPLKNLRNAQFMANEVPGVFVPQRILDRMAKHASAEDQLKEGLDICRETIEAVMPRVQGLQVSAPMGNVAMLEGLLKPVTGFGRQ